MLKHCSPSSVDLRRRSRRNLLSIIDTTSGSGSNDLDQSCSSTSSSDMFRHVIDISEEDELDLCEDVVSVKSFSSQSNSNNSNSNHNSNLSSSTKG